ncbi:hypothetical protein F5X96DRAFT_600770 [Biscogniauxia mediterranea]|nr:hypothetical protein F5X96DRAFT_600770 [Biscogniauxia mediterranea]
MHLPRGATLPPTLLSFLLLSGSPLVSAIAARSECLRQSTPKFVEAAACGDKGSLDYCFKRTPEYLQLDDLAECFRNAGCTEEESVIEAAYIIKNCDEGKSAAELRRRIPDPMPAPTPMPQDTTTTDTTDTTATSSSNSATASCSTTTTISTSSCPVQSTGTASGATLSCFATTTASAVCRADATCRTDGTCFIKDDTLDTGEIVVTVILAVALALSVAAFLFFCCRDKCGQRKARARKEAADIARTQAANNAAGAKMQDPFLDTAH